MRPGLAESIRSGLAVPILSDEAIFGLALEGHRSLAEAYAEDTGYTLDDRANLPRIAKFHKLQRQNENLLAGSDWTDNDLRADYLDFVKDFLLDHAEAQGVDDDTLDAAEAQRSRTTVSAFARVLGYPQLNQGAQNPLLVLANLPFRVFLTTSPYTFLEMALATAGKTPRTTVIRWRQDLRDIIDSRDDDLPHN